MARGWRSGRPAAPAPPVPSASHGAAAHPATPLGAVSLLRKTGQAQQTPLPKRGGSTAAVFAEVDRAAGPTARMTAAPAAAAAAAPEKAGRAAAAPGLRSGSGARATEDDHGAACASSPPPPLTTIGSDVPDGSACAGSGGGGGGCTSSAGGAGPGPTVDDDRPTDGRLHEAAPMAGGGRVIYNDAAPRPILVLRQEACTAAAAATSTTGGTSKPHQASQAPPGPRKSRTNHRRRISWNECVSYALIPPLAEIPPRVRRDLYYTADEEGTYRAAAKDEIRALRRHPAVVRVNQTAAAEHGNDLFAPRDYHHHSTLSDRNDDVSLHYCTRGVEHHLLPRDLRRERSARIKGVVEAVLYDQYYQHERGIYDEDRLAWVSQKRTRQFRRRARELAKADEAEMVAWLSRDGPVASRRVGDDDDDGGDDDDDDEEEPRDHPMDQSSKSLCIEEAVLPPPTSPFTSATASATFKDKFDSNFRDEVVVDDDDNVHGDEPPSHDQDQQRGMNLECDDFADVNLDSYTSLDQRLEQQYHREMSERLMARMVN